MPTAVVLLNKLPLLKQMTNQLIKKLTVLKDTNLLSRSRVKGTSELLFKYISWAKRRSKTNTPDGAYYKKDDSVSLKGEERQDHQIDETKNTSAIDPYHFSLSFILN